MMSSTIDELVLFDFGAGSEPWRNIDDVVMGGRSQSDFAIDGGVATFRGIVSLADGGGFASVRSEPADHDLSAFDGIALRVLSDGKTYGVRLRTSGAFDGVNYQAALAVEPGEWTDVRLPFSAFEPVYRGRPVPGHPALDPGAVKTFGFIVADRQAGPFRLEIDSIAAFRGGDVP